MSIGNDTKFLSSGRLKGLLAREVGWKNADCVICLGPDPDTVIMPCGHLSFAPNSKFVNIFYELNNSLRTICALLDINFQDIFVVTCYDHLENLWKFEHDDRSSKHTEVPRKISPSVRWKFWILLNISNILFTFHKHGKKERRTMTDIWVWSGAKMMCIL